MSKLMLIDAVHPEETRVAVAENNRVNDFDFETAGKRQLRGNIYLAKITRVEPSLQAAFVEYGGNRHGFLAFSEIHPDYYQLPKEDREALLREAAEIAAAEENDDDDDDETEGAELDGDDEVEAAHDDDIDEDDDDEHDDDDDVAELSEDEADDDEDGDDDEEAEASGEDKGVKPAAQPSKRKGARKRSERRPSLQKRYKIQEVIRRRQVLLVQVVKEERGNKGAALTTYLSLAGRYSVLMPNTPRGGGISRKISSGADRKRLKDIVRELEVPQGMGLIVRTAGAKRTKVEIRRDYEYLNRLWNQICDKTLSSMAPTLIHEEGGLVHRAMRDMFDKDIEEVLIQGDDAYREAKELAKMIMPSQAKKVKQWKDTAPVFVAEGVEDQLDQIYSPEVKMKSGGYLVINQTEALVAIDVNSGKSTRERNIEQTALRTNLEAAEEACRQMRLRDLAGLIVIDFIDMDENKNNRAVEKKLKECLKLDRARVQHGRISQFGLMEISRQRRRAGVLQATSDPCGACKGTGRRRSTSSAALQLLRTIESRVATGGLKSLKVTAPTEVALYLLNNKREAVSEIETLAGFAISIASSDEMMPGDFELDAERDPNAKSKTKRKRRSRKEDTSNTEEETDVEEIDEDDETSDEEKAHASQDDEKGGEKKKRRRRGRRGGRRRRKSADPESNLSGEDAPDSPSSPPAPAPEDGGEFLDGVATSPSELLEEEVEAKSDKPEETTADKEDAPKRKSSRRRSRRKKSDAKVEETSEAKDETASTKTSDAAPEAETAKAEDKKAEPESTAEPKQDAAPEEKASEPEAKPEPEPEPVAAETSASPAPNRPKRKGWWSR